MVTIFAVIVWEQPLPPIHPRKCHQTPSLVGWSGDKTSSTRVATCMNSACDILCMRLAYQVTIEGLYHVLWMSSTWILEDLGGKLSYLPTILIWSGQSLCYYLLPVYHPLSQKCPFCPAPALEQRATVICIALLATPPYSLLFCTKFM